MREPSDPSMKPLSMPVCSMLSDWGCAARCACRLLSWIVEGQPLGDARGELSVAFDFLENLEIIPTYLRLSVVGIVLRGGDAPLRPDSCRAASMACRRRSCVGLGNDGEHRLARGFAQNAGGLAGGIAIDFSALRILAGDGDAGQLQCAGVGHRDVSIDALQKYRMIGGDFIDVPAAGQVPSPATESGPSRRRQSIRPVRQLSTCSRMRSRNSVERLHADQFHGRAAENPRSARCT